MSDDVKATHPVTGHGGRHPKSRDRQRGQALALFALALTGLLVASGLVIDGGLAFMNRRDAQNAADMAALAGTRIVAEYHIDGGVSGSDVWNAIDAAVAENGCTGGAVPCSWEAEYTKPAPGGGDMTIGQVNAGAGIPGDAQGVEVRIDLDPPTFFLPLIGRDDWDISTVAAAIAANVDVIEGNILLPIAVDPIPPDMHPRKFQSGTIYQFSLGKDAPGQFSWLTWYGPNQAGELAYNICNPSNPPYDLTGGGVWIEGDTGKTNANDVRECLAKWIGRTVLLPLWSESVDGNGNSATFKITGFAFFQLLGFDANPAIDNLKGQFKEYGPMSIGKNYGGPPCDPADGGTCLSQSYFLGLIR
jgi:hypothetical protein